VSRYLAFIIVLIPFALQAQITAPESRAVRMTDYPATTRHDPIFIFCIAGAGDTGSLTAASPGGTAPFTFVWTMFDQTTGSYSIPVKTETGVTSTAGGLAEGGYKVNISDGLGYNTDLYAWVNLDKPVANAALLNFTCDYVALDGTKAPDNFYYYDPSTGASRRLPNGVSHLWSSTPPSAIPYPDLEIDPVTFSPPLVDVRYTLQVTDSFGCASSSSFDYTSIHVKAEFTAEPTEGESPLEVIFTDKSVRGFHYTWKFGDDSISVQPDPGTHTYYIPGVYYAVLTIESELTCTDTDSIRITVDPSSLQIPNVFTPNDDGINDFFMPEKKSLKYVNLQIFAKSGHRVYSYEGEGEALRDWQGWDGKINNSERLAIPGTYYYVMRAIGYDDVEYKGKEYRGALYLFR
jgi:gliding motility-associated-like protein